MIRLNEAFARSTEMGIKMQKQELAALLWPDSTKMSQKQNILNLQTGLVKRIDPEHVKIICEKLQCDPNFLFGYEK